MAQRSEAPFANRYPSRNEGRKKYRTSERGAGRKIANVKKTAKPIGGDNIRSALGGWDFGNWGRPESGGTADAKNEGPAIRNWRTWHNF